MEDSLGTTDDFAIRLFHSVLFFMFSAALVELAKSISDHSCSLPTSSSDCLPCSFFFHCALYYLFAETEHIEAWPNHLSFRFLTKISSPCTPMTSSYGHRTENDVVLTSHRRLYDVILVPNAHWAPYSPQRQDLPANHLFCSVDLARKVQTNNDNNSKP